MLDRDSLPITPTDAHNRSLLELTRPADWVNPTVQNPYDLLVVGAGTAGLVAAAGARGLGARVALIERRLLGGDCLNFGCVPSKALLYAAAAAHTARSSARQGVRADVQVDFAQTMSWVRHARAQVAPHDAATRFRERGIDVFFGSARFTGPDSVQVGERRLSFKRALIATGSRPQVPNIPGLAEAGHLTNESVFELCELPKRLVVVGGGPIGCELAQAFTRLGAEVSLLQRGPRLLPRDDPRASELLAERLMLEGVRVVLGADVERIELTDDGKRVTFATAGQSSSVACDQILIATGRTANVDGLGLNDAGVGVDAEGVVVDDRLRTKNRRIYAAGDVCSRYKFTHAADAMARVVLQNALFFGRKRASALVVPWCTYTDPEVAHVGLSAAEAEAAGLCSVHLEVGDNDRAITEGRDVGFARAYHTGRRGRIVGATLVGHGAGELIGELALAMKTGAGLAELSKTIHPYPTRSGLLGALGDQFVRSKLGPGLLRWLERYFAWRR